MGRKSKGERKLVYCAHCASMLRNKGLSPYPLCVARKAVMFVRGVTYKIVGIEGLQFCVVRNKRNNCKLYTPWWNVQSFLFKKVVERTLLKGDDDGYREVEYRQLEELRRKGTCKKKKQHIFCIEDKRVQDEERSEEGSFRIDHTVTGRYTPEKDESGSEDRGSGRGGSGEGDCTDIEGKEDSSFQPE